MNVGKKVETEGLKLKFRRDKLVAAFQADMFRLKREHNNLNRTERLLKTTEAKAERAATGNSGRVRSLASQLKQLATYDQFSSEHHVLILINADPEENWS